MPTVTALPTPPNRATDTPTEFADNADALLGALPTFVTELNEYGEALADSNGVANYSATSVTSNSVGTGSKSFTVETGKRYVAGTFLVIADAAAPTTNFMFGQVTSYNSLTGALVFDSQRVGGSGTKTAWLLSLSGPQGTGGDVLPSFAGNFGKSLTVNSSETAGEWTFPDAYCYLSANYTLTSTTATQKLFNASTNGTLTLPTGRYWFEMLVNLDQMSAFSGNGVLYLKGAGTAVIADGLAAITGKDSAPLSAAAFESGILAVSGGDFAPSIAGAGTNTAAIAMMGGHFSVTTAGTIIPSIALTTASPARVLAGSSFICRRIGGIAATNGSWT